LTFTDAGKLKALKPDITLSIVKNLADEQLPLKVFYDEAVYRVKKGDREFSELRQMGLELIGDDSPYAGAEVICLAKASLNNISDDNILDISHMGIIVPLIDKACEGGIDKQQLVQLITQKNADGIRSLLKDKNISSPIAELVEAYLPLCDMVAKLELMFPDSPAVYQLSELSKVLSISDLEKNVYVDFSLIQNIGYYNGIIFNGYIKDVPVSVLSGGRYDPLLERFGRKTSAIGFAIYLDYIQYNDSLQETDVLLIYSEQDNAQSVAAAVKSLTEQGYAVMASKKAPSNRSFAKTLSLQEVLS
jgi:ATP phosphoribosyltransferase regulatory subunit